MNSVLHAHSVWEAVAGGAVFGLLFSLPALLIPSSWRKRRREHKGERRDAMIKHGITKAMWRAGHRPPASP